MLAHIKYAALTAYYRLRYLAMRRQRRSVEVLDSWQTVDYIIKHHCSVSRYGDGELNMVYNYEDRADSRSSGFQKFDPEMGRRLKEILCEGGADSANHCVAVEQEMFGKGTRHLRRHAATFWEGFSVRYLDRTLPMMQSGKRYLNTGFSRFYLSQRDKSRCREYIERVKEIWRDRDVLIVEGMSTRLGVGNDLFEGARSVRRILCPPKNAWGSYDAILSSTIGILSRMGGG